jgi:hypothetical protein
MGDARKKFFSAFGMFKKRQEIRGSDGCNLKLRQYLAGSFLQCSTEISTRVAAQKNFNSVQWQLRKHRLCHWRHEIGDDART